MDVLEDYTEKSRRKEKRYLGDRLRPPVRLSDFLPLARTLLLTGALVVVLILLIELLLLKARGAEPVAAATDNQAFACVRFPSFPVS